MLNARLAFFFQKMLYALSNLVYNNFERMCNFMQSIATISFNEFESILNNNELVFVDFFASWCGPCKMFSPVVEQISQKYKDKITVLKIDIDENSEIAEKYSIQSVPTSILFKNNNIVERVSGMISFNQCSDLVDKYLN